MNVKLSDDVLDVLEYCSKQNRCSFDLSLFEILSYSRQYSLVVVDSVEKRELRRFPLSSRGLYDCLSEADELIDNEFAHCDLYLVFSYYSVVSDCLCDIAVSARFYSELIDGVVDGFELGGYVYDFDENNKTSGGFLSPWVLV